MEPLEACQLREGSFTDLSDFIDEAKFLACFYLFEENIEEDLVDVLDWVGGDVGG